MRVCVITTSFPKTPGDFAGSFILDQLKRQPKSTSFDVITPHRSGIPKQDSVAPNINVHRFSYFIPHSLQCVTQTGIYNNLKKPCPPAINTCNSVRNVIKDWLNFDPDQDVFDRIVIVIPSQATEAWIGILKLNDGSINECTEKPDHILSDKGIINWDSWYNDRA